MPPTSPEAETPIGWTGQNDGGLTGVKAFAWFSRTFGPRLGPPLLAIGTWFAIPFLTQRRRGSEYFFRHLRNRRVGTMRRLLDTYRQFLAFTLCWHERNCAFVLGESCLKIEVRGQEIIDQIRASGRGLMLLTGHFSNYELGAWLLRRQGAAVSVVMIDREVPQVAAFVENMKGAERPRIIAVNQSPLSALAIVAALRHGEIVCMQGDRNTGADAVSLPFLGHRAEFPTGMYRVATVAQAAVVPIFCERVGRAHYRFTLHAPLPAHDPAKAAQQFAAHLERYTRQQPEYWFNLYEFFSDSGAP